MSEQMKLAAALAEVIAEVEGVEKTGVNKQQGYNYVTAEALLRAVRGPLAKRGLTLLPSVESVEREQTGQTHSGAPIFLTTVHVRFLILGSDKEDAVFGPAVTWVGTGLDTGDKGVYKAYTGAIKTFLRTLLLLPQDQDDPERDDVTPAGKPEPLPELSEDGQKALKEANDVYDRLKKAGWKKSAVEFGKDKTAARRGGDDGVREFVLSLRQELAKLEDVKVASGGQQA